MGSPDFTVLLAEDDDGHALLVRKNLERAGCSCPIVRFRDGQEVLDYLRLTPGRNAESQGQVLLLLDINMPRASGLDVLKSLKENPATARIPVIMLTTTDNPREIARCYELGCNIYVTKPVVYEQFVDAIARLGMFLQVIRVPFKSDVAC